LEWWTQLSELIRNLGIVAGGIFGLYLAWKRVTAANRQAEASIRQAELARRSHVAELFDRAVGQLKDERIEIRLGAIYTLRQIGTDFPDLAGAVFELLSAYMRENPGTYGDKEPPPDVREIVRILKRQLGQER
jgi:hypothetical protein